MDGGNKDLLKLWNGKTLNLKDFVKNLRKEDINTEELKNIFNIADTNQDNIISNEECSIFAQKLLTYAGSDNNLSETEANKMLTDNFGNNKFHPEQLLDFISILIPSKNKTTENTQSSTDFNTRIEDLKNNPEYTRKTLVDIYGYPYQMIYAKDKLVGIISRNSIKFYTEETKGQIYSLNGEYECDFEQAKNETVNAGEAIPEKRYYSDGCIVECDKNGNTRKFDKDGNLIETVYTEVKDGVETETTINYQNDTTRVLNSSVDGVMYKGTDESKTVLYNIYTDLDRDGRITLQTREYPDGRIIIGTPANFTANLTDAQKDAIASDFIGAVKDDISKALQILKDYNAGKGMLGSAAQLFMQDDSTADAKIAHYEELLKKLESLENASGNELEAELKNIFGENFNYNIAYAFSQINKKLSEAVSLTQTINAIDTVLQNDSVLTLKIPENKKPMLNILQNQMEALPGIQNSAFTEEIKDKEFAEKAHKALTFILGDPNLAQDYIMQIYRQAGREKEAKTLITKTLTEIKNNLKNKIGELTNGKGTEFLTKQAEEVYSTAFRDNKNFAQDASGLVETYMLGEAYLEMGITVTLTLATLGTGAVASIGRACITRLGPKVGSVTAKILATAMNASIPSALTYIDAASSQNGITSETNDIALEKFKSGMLYGSFGSFISGPLGNALTKFASGKGMTLLASNCLGTSLETSADIVLDRLTGDLSIKESFMQNGGMNFAMMFLGGRIAKNIDKKALKKLNKQIEQNLQKTSITQHADGSYKIVFENQILADKSSPEKALGVIFNKIMKDIENSPAMKSLQAGVSQEAVVTASKTDIIKSAENTQTPLKETLSTEEYITLQTKVKNKLAEFNISGTLKLNEFNLQLADIIFSNEKLMSSVDLKDKLGWIIQNTTNLEKANAKKIILESLMADSAILDDKNIRQNIGKILFYTKTQEQGNFVSQFLTNKNLYGNENITNYLIDKLKNAEPLDIKSFSEKVKHFRENINKPGNRQQAAGSFENLGLASNSNPQTITINNKEYTIVKCEETQNNEKILTTNDNKKLVLDKQNRLIMFDAGIQIKKLSYPSDNAKEPNLIELFDCEMKSLSKTVIEDKRIIKTDYEKGQETVIITISGKEVTRDLTTDEYPTNVSEKAKLYTDLKPRIRKCQTIEEVKALYNEYSSMGYSIPKVYINDQIQILLANEAGSCKTIEELNRFRAKYDTEEYPCIRILYNGQTNVIVETEIKSCQTIEELKAFKESYAKNGVTFDTDIYDRQAYIILDKDLRACKTLEELEAVKNKYLQENITIEEDVFTGRFYDIVLFEIKNCTTPEAVDALQIKFKTKGLNISDKIFSYYKEKLTNPEYTESEIKIKSGNMPIEQRFLEYDFNPNDPKYKNDIPGVFRDLQSRLEREMGVLSPEQISQIAARISKKMQIPEERVLQVMSELTQFGNMKALKQLGTELQKRNISGFFEDTGISTNSTFNYLLTKEQIALKPTKEQKKAFILDAAGMKYLENLSETQRQNFYKQVRNKEIILIELEGTGLKVGNNYYSYTMLDGGQNLEAMTETVFEQAKNGKTAHEVLQGDFRERLDKIFGSSFSRNYLTSISLKGKADANNIAAQIRPNMPDAKYMEKAADTVIKNSEGLTDKEKILAKSVIAKYYDYMAKIYSSDSFAELLRAKHSAIEQHVFQLGKTMDDVVYIYPAENKSFDLVCLQYAKINGIDTDKIILYDGMRHNKNLDGKVVVLLDDVVGSGDSMISQKFHYQTFLHTQNDVNMLFVPITCAESGRFNIIGTIKKYSRNGMDFLVYDNTQSSKYTDFVNYLTPEEARILDKIIGDKGYDNGGLVTGFQYMIPDNNSSLSGYFNLPNLNNSTTRSANKTDSYDDDIGYELRKYLETEI